jgi:hypothetical protein
VTEARAHHFVPQCWLTGFTDSGEQDSRLYVTDLARKKQWPSNPQNTGHRRDFNRVKDPSLEDPLAIEKLFSKIESDVAPLFRSMFQQRRGPSNGDELGMLLEYMAIQWVRVPTFRAIVDRTVFSHFNADALSSQEAWESTLRKAAIPPDALGTDYQKMMEAMNSGHITFTGQPGYYLRHSANLIQAIDDSLKKMKWDWLISEKGNFIGSDSPVALDGPENKPVGFRNADVVSYPVNRHVVLYGTPEPVPPQIVTTKLIARHNTFAMLSADEQIYSHRPDFHWLDVSNKSQNDWKLFSREEFYLSNL